MWVANPLTHIPLTKGETTNIERPTSNIEGEERPE